jgi:hypothetical protein
MSLLLVGKIQEGDLQHSCHGTARDSARELWLDACKNCRQEEKLHGVKSVDNRVAVSSKG